MDDERTERALSEYEAQQASAITAWKREAPGVANQAFGVVVQPAAWLIQRVIPEAAIKAAIDGASRLGRSLADDADLLRDAGVSEIAALRAGELTVCDRLASGVHNWAIGMAAAEGTATGALGILSAPVDIPAIITLALRTIHKIGLCYGYASCTEEDETFVRGILAASGANSMEEKLAALAALNALRTVLLQQSWQAMGQKALQDRLGKEAILVLIRNLAKQVGINVTKRRALAAIPAIGAVIGGSVNAWYLKEVGWAARRAFQERWLIDAGKLEPGADSRRS
jgi:hypothetical protein